MRAAAILFDLDDTLRFSRPSDIDVVQQMAAELGLVTTPERRRAARRWLHHYWSGGPELQADERAGEGEQDGRFWRRQIARHLQVMGARPPRAAALAERIFARLEAEFAPADHVPADVVPALRRLRGRGLKLGVVSNREEAIADLLVRLGLDPFFEVVLSAGQVGLRKPDPAILLAAADRLAVAVDQVVYVGDNPFLDVACSAAAGMQPVLLDSAGLFGELAVTTIRAIGELPSLLLETDRRWG